MRATVGARRSRCAAEAGGVGGGRSEAGGTIYDRGEPFDVAILQATHDLLSALSARATLGRTLGAACDRGLRDDEVSKS